MNLYYKKSNNKYRREARSIQILYKNKKVERLCTDLKYATKELGKDISRTLIRRIEEIKAFNRFGDIPAGKPWKREKIDKKDNRWSLRVNDTYRIELIIKEENIKIEDIENIEIERVSNHYE